jgi:hypothetical protein
LKPRDVWKEEDKTSRNGMAERGRPKKEATPAQTVYYLVPTIEVDQHEVTVLVRKKAAFEARLPLGTPQRVDQRA